MMMMMMMIDDDDDDDDDIITCTVIIAIAIIFSTLYTYMNKEKNLSPSQGLNLGLPNTSQMLLPLRHQDS